jgi:hypothetical protein
MKNVEDVKMFTYSPRKQASKKQLFSHFYIQRIFTSLQKRARVLQDVGRGAGAGGCYQAIERALG